MKVHFTYRIPAGETAPVDSLLAIIGKEGEDISALLWENQQRQLSCRQAKPTSEAVAVPETTKESSSVATTKRSSGNNDASFK
jgi:pyruvate dehydrogenase E2 component (dihydrolipoamide acetyltransferase)